MSSSMPWFRMYVDFLNDPKMITLAFEDQRHFIGLLALKSDGALDSGCAPDLLDRIVAQRLWIDHVAIREVKKRLMAVGLISEDWQPLAWDKRQFRSDSSKDRVAKHRANKKTDIACNVTGNAEETTQQRLSNALDTDTDTEEGSKDPLSTGEPDDEPRDESIPACPHRSLIDLYGEHLPELPQPRPEAWSGARAKALASRWRWVMTAKKREGERYATTREEGLDFFGRYFAYVAERCPHLTGSNDRNWTADLAWLAKESNFSKVLEGNYERKDGGGK